MLNRLGATLSRTASDEDVRRAYRQLLRETHPDLHQDADATTLDRQSERLRAVIRAWDVFQQRTDVAA
jgi:curved DNA-binding protein CbpA